MFLFKRIFFALLGALGALFLDADPAHGLSKDEAVKKCEARITVLEQQKDRFGDKIAGIFGLALDDFKKMLTQLKASEDPPQIMSLYTTCQEGLTAVEWILNRYGKPSKVDSSQAPLVVNNASEIEQKRVAGDTAKKTVTQQPPVAIQKAKGKKKVFSKPRSIVRVNKKNMRKSKTATLKTKHRASKVSRNTTNPA